MSKKSWLAKKSFPVVVFFLPLLVLYGGLLLAVPKEVLSSKPSLEQFVAGMIGAVFGWFTLVIAFSFLWTFLMRLIYGSDIVRQWLQEEHSSTGRIANTIEKFMRWICEFAL
ncbi:hypothetical protein D3C72_1739570 [compost metagenome]